MTLCNLYYCKKRTPDPGTAYSRVQVFTVALPNGYGFFGQYCFRSVGVLNYETVLPFWFTRSTGSTVGTPVFDAWEYAFRHGFPIDHTLFLQMVFPLSQ